MTMINIIEATFNSFNSPESSVWELFRATKLDEEASSQAPLGGRSS